ncbi:hypothetical protein nACB1_060 [Acinetobacter phage nACB1]|nr:hypothetical protein nACB1_060 [Acinetobacter phage nACB1]
MKDILPHVQLVNSGYLVTPMNANRVKPFTLFDDTLPDHSWGWPEYALWDSDVYPDFLSDLANKGIAFGWEFAVTEDISYFAYNFPTKESKNNLVWFNSTGRRKSLPRMTKKLRLELETESSINELLFTIGIKPDGTT